MNNNYGSILTMILIVLIVAILGILGYFTYDFFYAQAVKNNANVALEEFENSIKETNKNNAVAEPENTVVQNTVIENTVDTEVVNPQDLLNQVNPNPVVQPEENPDDNKVMMEDYEVLGRINIPKTGVDLPVLDSVGKRALELAVGVAYGPGLNQPGNTVIFGHNYRTGNLFFTNNKNLTNGDKVHITDKNNVTVTYVIYNVYEAEQSDTSFMQREVEEGVREISLQTCTDRSDDMRIIVWAREEGK